MRFLEALTGKFCIFPKGSRYTTEEEIYLVKDKYDYVDKIIFKSTTF